MFYKGGSEIIIEWQDSGKWSFFKAVNLVKDWGYDGFRLCRNILGINEGFIHFIDDVQTEEISNHNLGSNVDGHIWVEYGVKDMLSKVSKPDVDQFIECSDDDNTDDCDGGVKFDDGEEERTCEREKGFVEVEVERPISGNRFEVNEKSIIFKVIGSKSSKNMKSPRKTQAEKTNQTVDKVVEKKKKIVNAVEKKKQVAKEVEKKKQVAKAVEKNEKLDVNNTYASKRSNDRLKSI
ncbi:hypothetical protein KIW84_010436 [Lathyrus oleraceus]|uniref:Uncharacterized protein n=1 Tax=Pisum sativum TaxID=3888 RepID=A0A9D5BE51_PEA|nr:hypothetical protein KIW84_010436 [Pisum sativum]